MTLRDFDPWCDEDGCSAPAVVEVSGGPGFRHDHYGKFCWFHGQNEMAMVQVNEANTASYIAHLKGLLERVEKGEITLAESVELQSEWKPDQLIEAAGSDRAIPNAPGRDQPTTPLTP